MIISKRRILAIFAIIAVVVLLSLVGYFAVRTPGAGNTILELERSDRAPDGADDTDVSTRLEWNDDPAVFWSNRVVWLDREVMKAATDHGRAYPPMPYVDPEAMAIAPTPLRHYVESLDIDVPRLKGNNRERWFWDKFSRTHPHPPDYLDALFVSESMSSGDSLLTAKNNGDPRWTGKTPGGLGRLRRDYPKMGIPIEMLDAESLAACCHLIKGDKPYDASSFRLSQQLAAGTIPAVEEFLERGFENASEVESELKTAYAWRTKYVRRLRREGTDESYIEAYKKAWDLSEDDLRKGQKRKQRFQTIAIQPP